MEKDKIIVEELEDKAEPTVKDEKATGLQSMNSADIGAIFFSGDKLTILPKDFEQRFGIDGKVTSLAGKDMGDFDLSKLAGAFERVTELEKSVAEKDKEIAELKANMVDKPEDEKKDEEPEPVPDPEKEKDKEKAEADKKDEKDSATAKSVEAEKSTKEEAEHSMDDVDADIRGLVGGMQKARREGTL